MCQRLNCNWLELQQMPEEMVEMWDAILAGEAEGQELARKAKGG